MIRRDGRRLGDIRPADSDRALATLNDGGRSTARGTNNGLVGGLPSGQGSPNTSSGPNVSPPAVASNSPVMGGDTIVSSSVPESDEHTVAPEDTPNVQRPGHDTESSATPSSTARRGM